MIAALFFVPTPFYLKRLPMMSNKNMLDDVAAVVYRTA